MARRRASARAPASSRSDPSLEPCPAGILARLLEVVPGQRQAPFPGGVQRERNEVDPGLRPLQRLLQRCVLEHDSPERFERFAQPDLVVSESIRAWRSRQALASSAMTFSFS